MTLCREESELMAIFFFLRLFGDGNEDLEVWGGDTPGTVLNLGSSSVSLSR